MSVDKSIFTVMGEFASKLGKLFADSEISQEDKNNAAICAIVKKMMLNKSLDESDFDGIINKLEPIYRGKHRHSYSNISSTIYAEKEKADIECQKKNTDNEQLDVLADNNDKLHEYVISYFQAKENNAEQDNEKILVKFQKLYDHINLEVVRLKNYDDQIKRAIERIKESNADTQRQINEFNGKIEEKSREIDNALQKKLDDVQEESKKMRAEYISILGIFSSIVLAFVGGMTFSTSVLENINKASAYRVVLISLIIGLVFFNIIWILLDFIKSMHEKRYLWIIVNAILILGVVFSCIAYKYDWFNREEQITLFRNCQAEQEISTDNSAVE